MPSFKVITRNYQRIIVRTDSPVWIVRYPAIKGVRKAFWQVYRACVNVPKGREPWAVDNRRR